MAFALPLNAVPKPRHAMPCLRIASHRAAHASLYSAEAIPSYAHAIQSNAMPAHHFSGPRNAPPSRFNAKQCHRISTQCPCTVY